VWFAERLQTKTIAIAIYDRVQAFDLVSPNRTSVLLLSPSAAGASFFASRHLAVRR
jgi:molybdate transport system permease protein